MSEVIKNEFNGIRVELNTGNHRYKVFGEGLPEKGEYFDSVTGATGMKDKSRVLKQWAVDKTIDYLDDMGDHLAEILKNPIERDTLFQKKDFDNNIPAGTARTFHSIFLKDAADAGTEIHDAIEKYFKNEPVILEGMSEAARNGYTAFHSFMEKIEIVPEHIEVVMADKKNKVAGMADMIAKEGKKRILWDWKSGKGVYGETLIQLAGYAGIYKSMYGGKIDLARTAAFNKETGEPWINPDTGLPWYEVDADTLDWLYTEAFLPLLSVYRVDKKLNKILDYWKRAKK
jgi:hypothetical protein